MDKEKMAVAHLTVSIRQAESAKHAKGALWYSSSLKDFFILALFSS
jgi:hypothetical protein